MFDPMLARLSGFLVFAGLLGGLLMTVASADEHKHRDAVASVELQQRVTTALFTRQ